MQIPTDCEFQGTSRFQIVRRLGRGGFGVVYEALDRERQARVALKTLAAMSASGIYVLKQEFRALSDVTHPNLVALYELVSTGDDWFFTMELVDGVPFVAYVRGLDAEHATTETVASLPTMDELKLVFMAASSHQARVPRRGGQGSVRQAELRAALPQLVDGVAALHAAGKLHRDIKPSNVLVTPRGRVVLLDFGLVREGTRTFADAPRDEPLVVGTPEYMSPEQSIGDPTAPASDWYALGVMLFECLTGVLPFQGSPVQVISSRLLHEPPRPASLASGVPADLEALCLALLRRDPLHRPSAAEIARAVGARPAGGSIAARELRGDGLRGRAGAVRQLWDALEAVAPATPVVVEVWGPSGVGKTALVEHFLAQCRQRRGAVALHGRCYERESVPFKAVDSMVDALTSHLRRLPADDVEALLPPDVDVLVRLFPVLRRVSVLDGVGQHAAGTGDQQEVRRRGFAALKALLAALAARRTLVLCIDDLQWGDEDSAALLREILAAPNAPGLLLVASYRAQAAPPSFLDGHRPRASTTALDRRRLPVGPLSESEACDLALAMLGRDDADARATAALVARESEGSPFFVGELVRALCSGHGAPGEVSLARTVAARVAALPERERELLGLVALVGRPVPQRLVFEASDLGAEAYPAMCVLRAASLVRTEGARDHDAVECYHDRVRETVAAGWPPRDAARLHARLAAALLASGAADPAMLAVHFAGADDKPRAGAYAVLAAQNAERALAFDRAAQLYRQAREHLRGTPGDDTALSTRLGDALVNAGRAADAAAVYLAAAGETADADQAIELRRCAAEQLLIDGRHAEGLAVMRTVLDAVGLELPASPRRAQLALLGDLAWLTARGLKFRARPAHTVAPAVLRRVDVCHSAGVGTAFADSILSFGFLTRAMRLALTAGEPSRVARGLLRFACTLAVVGPAGERRALDVIRTAEALLVGDDSSQAQGSVLLARGFVDLVAGRWRAALSHLAGCEEQFRRDTSGVTWDLDIARQLSCEALWRLGDLQESLRRGARAAREAEDRGFLHGEVSMRVARLSYQYLCADAPAEAEREIADAMASWTNDAFLQVDFYEMVARAHVDLYRRQGARAYRRLRARWSALERSLMLRAQFFRIEAVAMRALCALAAAREATGIDRARLLAEVERSAQRLAGEGCRWASPYAPLLRAGVAAAHGDGGTAAELYAAAAAGFDGVETGMLAAVMRYRLGVLRGRDGRTLRADAEAALRAQGVTAPDRWVAVWAPG